MSDVYPVSAPEPRGMLGYDGTHYYVVRVDDQGNLRLAPGGVNLKQFASRYTVHKQVAAGAGNIVIDTDALSLTALVVVEQVTAVFFAGTATSVLVTAIDGVKLVDLAVDLAPVVSRLVTWTGELVLVNPCILRAQAFAVGAGTTFRLLVWGYYVRT